MDKKIKEQQAEYDDLMNEFKELQRRQERLNSEKYDLEREVDGQSSKLGGRESEYQVLLRDYEYAKEREAVLMGDRCVLVENSVSTYSVRVREIGVQCARTQSCMY